MAIDSIYKHPRGTRANLNALATAGQLTPGLVYILTDEDRLAVASTTSSFTTFLKEGEGGSGGSAPTWAPVTATGTGASQNITLPESGLTPKDILVLVNGMIWHTSEYSVTGTTLTLITNASGDSIEIRKPAGATGPKGDTGAAGSGGTGSAPDYPFFSATYSGGYSAGAAFTTVPMNAVATDTHNGWNAASNTWVVPSGQSGVYQVFGKYRISDSAGNGASIGIGLDTNNADSPTFYWGVTNPNRNGIMNQRFASFNAGQAIRLFSYLDGGNKNIEAAALNILRVK